MKGTIAAMMVESNNLKEHARALEIKHKSYYVIGGALILVFSFFIANCLPYNIPNKIVFAIVISLLALLLYLTIFLDVRGGFVLKINSQFVFFIAYIIALIIIGLSNLNDSPLTILFESIDSTIIFVRFIPTILIGFFLPGYAILSILKLNESFNRLEKFLYTILVSMLVTVFIGLISWSLGNMPKYAINILLITHTIILLGFLVSSRHILHVFSESHAISFSLIRFAIITLIISFLYVAFFSIHNINSPLPLLGDEYNHIGLIVKFLKNYNSWQEKRLRALTTPSYPYFFHLIEAVSSIVSKTSITNFYILSSIILLPLPLIAFIALVSALTTKNKILTIMSALVFQLFSGFGWIQAVLDYIVGNEGASIYSAAVSTNDIVFSTWFPTITAPYLIDVTVFLFCLELLCKKDLTSKRFVLALIPLLLLGLGSHFEKIFLLAGLMLILTFIQAIFQVYRFRTREMALASLISVGLIIFIDKSAPKNLFISTYAIYVIVYAVINIAILSFSFLIVRFNFIEKVKRCRDYIVYNAKMFALLLVLLIVLIWILEICYQIKSLAHGEIIPLYFMPIKLGMAGLFTLVWVFSLSREDFKRYSSAFLLMLAIFLMQLLLYHGPIPLYNFLGIFVEEFRFIRDVTWPIIALTGAAGILFLISILKKFLLNFGSLKQKLLHAVVLALLISIIMGSSPLSHLLKIQYMSSIAYVKEENYGLIRFFEKLTVPSGSSIYAPASLKNILYSITGALIYTPSTDFYGEILSRSNDISSIMFILKYLNVSYVITQANEQLPLTQILTYFPKVYYDDFYNVYQLTEFLPPLPYAPTILLASNYDITETLLDYGIEGFTIWVDEFYNISQWQPDIETFSNVVNHTVTFKDGILHMWVQGIENSKIVAFYKIMLQNPILVEDELFAFVKFKTGHGARLMVHILYNDGTMNNTIYEGSVYMKSKVWATSITEIKRVGKHITGFRIGISNLFNLNLGEISAEIDYLGLFKRSKPPRLINAIASLSLAQVNYTLANSLNNIFLSSSCRNVIVVDEVDYPYETLTELWQLAEKGCNIIVVGEFLRHGIISKFMNFNITGRLLPVSNIQFKEGERYHIPRMYAPEIVYNGGEVLASYETDVGSIPLLLRLNFSENSSFIYLNLWPLIEALKNSGSKEQIEIQHFLSLLFGKIIGTSVKDIDRLFYLKNIGPIIVEGKINILFHELILPKNLTEGLKFHSGTNFKLIINGSIEIYPYMFSYAIVNVYGKALLLEDSLTIFCLNVSGLKLMAKVSTIQGNGKVTFSSLTSSMPYQVKITGAEYKCIGFFDFSAISLSNTIIFIYPYSLGGFTSR